MVFCSTRIGSYTHTALSTDRVPPMADKDRHRPYHDDPRWQAARDRLVSIPGLDSISQIQRQTACDQMVLIEIEYGYPNG